MLKPIRLLGYCALITLTACQNAPEQNLATLDGKKDAKDYTALLDEVAPKCSEDRAKIADLTTQSVANQKGTPVTHFKMLSELRNSLTSQQGKQSCTNLYVLVGMAIKGSQ